MFVPVLSWLNENACTLQADAVLCSYLFSNSTSRSDLRLTLPQAGSYTVEIVVGEPSSMVTRVALTNVWSGAVQGVTFLELRMCMCVPVLTRLNRKSITPCRAICSRSACSLASSSAGQKISSWSTMNE